MSILGKLFRSDRNEPPEIDLDAPSFAPHDLAELLFQLTLKSAQSAADAFAKHTLFSETSRDSAIEELILFFAWRTYCKLGDSFDVCDRFTYKIGTFLADVYRDKKAMESVCTKLDARIKEYSDLMRAMSGSDNLELCTRAAGFTLNQSLPGFDGIALAVHLSTFDTMADSFVVRLVKR